MGRPRIYTDVNERMQAYREREKVKREEAERVEREKQREADRRRREHEQLLLMIRRTAEEYEREGGNLMILESIIHDEVRKQRARRLKTAEVDDQLTIPMSVICNL